MAAELSPIPYQHTHQYRSALGRATQLAARGAIGVSLAAVGYNYLAAGDAALSVARAENRFTQAVLLTEVDGITISMTDPNGNPVGDYSSADVNPKDFLEPFAAELPSDKVREVYEDIVTGLPDAAPPEDFISLYDSSLRAMTSAGHAELERRASNAKNALKIAGGAAVLEVAMTLFNRRTRKQAPQYLPQVPVDD